MVSPYASTLSYDGTELTNCIITRIIEMSLVDDLFGYGQLVNQRKLAELIECVDLAIGELAHAETLFKVIRDKSRPFSDARNLASTGRTLTQSIQNLLDVTKQDFKQHRSDRIGVNKTKTINQTA